MAKYKRLSRQELLSAQDIEEREEYVREWGGSVVLRSLTLDQARAVTHALRTGDGGTDEIAATMAAIVQGLADPKLDPGDVEALRQKNAGVIARLSKQIMEMSGLTDVAREVERAEGN